jgi:hypothetical protein
MTHDTYCILTATKHAFNAKCDMTIDLGQQNTSTEYADVLKDYISEADALNYMASQGWDIVSCNSNQSLIATKYTLRKKGIA